MSYYKDFEQDECLYHVVIFSFPGKATNSGWFPNAFSMGCNDI